MIQAAHLKKVYRLGGEEVRALDGVTLRIRPGEFVAVMGASGSGKSTLLHTLGLLDRPDSGSYRLGGVETSQMAEAQLARLRSETLGFIFQQFNLLPRATALENVLLPGLYHPEKSSTDRARSLLEEVGLGDRVGHRPSQLSGGQQQREAIARALYNRPRDLLADEPTGNLDSASTREILKLLRGLHARGLTLIMVTHEDDVAAVATRVLKMKDGRVVGDRARRKIPSLPVAAAAPMERPRGWFSSLGAYFAQAFRALAANKVRSFLSVLGILIGVAAVIAMLAIGTGAQRAIEAQLSSLGANLLLISPGGGRQGAANLGSGSAARFGLEDARALGQVAGVFQAAGEVNGRVQAVAKGNNASTSLVGAEPSYAAMRAAPAALGAYFTDSDLRARARVCLLGVSLSRELFGEQNPVGQTLRLNRVSFRVIGVLKPKGGSGWRDEDDKVVVPLTTAMYRVLGKDKVDFITVQVEEGRDMAAVQEGLSRVLRRRLRQPEGAEDNFNIFNMAEIRDAVSATSRTISTLLASIAAISLLVGGIGIMNIMLVSVTERTREIGLRKALGARGSDILSQFLIEAVVVSLAGGVAGLALGWASALLVRLLAGWNAVVAPSAVLMAVAFSAGVGVVFGLWPARQASRLDPIQALRYE